MSTPPTGAITGKEVELQQRTRIRLSFLIGVIFASNVIFFSVMWASALILGGQPITQTFSWILARNTTVQIIYAAWWVFYLFVNLIVFFVLLEKTLIYPHAFHETDPPEEHRPPEQHRYTAGIWFYIALNLLKIACLLLLFLFPDIGDTTTLHLVWAGIAFGSAIAGCWVIFIIRATRKEWIKSETITRPAILFLNFLSLWAEVVMGIMFVFTPIDNAGVYEFTLALLIMLDTFYILLDYVYDSLDLELIFRHVRRKKS